jgi:hypothetical protein
MLSGDELRDWTHAAGDAALFLYNADFEAVDLSALPPEHRYMWAFRSSLSNNKMFGKQTKLEAGLKWWEYGRLTAHKLKTPLTITFAEIATHNHFVLDRGGKVFKQTAPVIKLPTGSTEDEHLGLLGLLNSSVACFWMKQVCFNKGNGGIGGGISDEKWELRYAHNASQVADFPLITPHPLNIATRLDTQSRQLAALQPAALLATGALPTRASLNAARDQAAQLRRTMIATQEELDWRCYRLYGLLPNGVTEDEVEYEAQVEVALGERAFEIVLARFMAAGLEQTTWFERHGSKPITEIPAHWPEGYRRVVARRIELIEREKSIGLIERPEFKRRWNTPDWHDQEQAALRDWLLGRLEAPSLWPASADQPPQLASTSRLAEAVSRDPEFMQVAALYAGHADFDLRKLVAELVAAEAVPALPAQRYTDTGLRKRTQWQDTWALQRREDAIDAEVDVLEAEQRQKLMRIVGEQAGGAEPDADALAWVREELGKKFAPLRKARKALEVGAIPVPPKYQSKDFLKADVWRLRGSLDVPKERWISFPGCERGADGSLVIAWAGWNHLQQATAIASYYFDMKESEGWEPARLQPLLVSLLELLPWLKQWHNEPDPVHGHPMGDYYRDFVSDEARELGFTLDDLRDWKPAVVAAKRGRRKAI